MLLGGQLKLPGTRTLRHIVGDLLRLWYHREILLVSSLLLVVEVIVLLLARLVIFTDVAIVHIVIDVIVYLLLNGIEIHRMLALVRLLVHTSVGTFIIIVGSADTCSILKGTI